MFIFAKKSDFKNIYAKSKNLLPEFKMRKQVNKLSFFFYRIYRVVRPKYVQIMILG